MTESNYGWRKKFLGRDPELVALSKRLLAVEPDRKSLLPSDALGDTRKFFRTNEDIFSNIGFFIINVDGISIGSMRDANVGIRNLISIQQPDLFRRALEGEVLFVPPIESDVPLGKEVKADETRNSSTKFFMGPIQDANGQIIAVMTLRMNPSEDFSRILPSSEARRTAETYAFSEHGELLSESKFADQLRQIGLIGADQSSALNVAIRDPGVNLLSGQRAKVERPKQPFTRMISGALELKREMEKRSQTYGRSKIEINTNGYRDYRGVPVFGAWLWNADLGLGLASEIDVAEALSSYHQIRRTVFGLLAVTLLLSVGATMFVLLIGERTSHALIKARDELELRVQERTNELRESEIQLRTIFERSPLGILHIGKDGIVLDCNDRHAEIMGSTREKIIGMNLREGIKNEEVRAAVFGALAGAQTVFEAEYTSISGGKTVAVRSVLNPTEPGTSPTEVINTTEDITERKQAEEAIRESRERLNTILKTTAQGFWLVDKDDNILDVNKATCEILDLPKEEIVGRNFWDFLDEENREIVREQNRIRKKGKQSIYEISLFRSDGTIVPCLNNAAPLLDKDGNVVGSFGMTTNITERKQMEEDLRRNVEELERFNKLAIEREMRMIQLKQEINELMSQLGQGEKYKIVK
jgi:PAS domain S-box-containing protein